MPISHITGVLCSGNICHDIPVWPVDQFTWGTTLWVEELNNGIGGNGANTSYTIGKLGCPSKIYGIVGRDSQGDQLLAILHSAGVNVDSVLRGNSPTNSTVCVVNSSGDRLFLHRLGCNKEMDASVLQFDSPAVSQYSHFHMANPFTLPAIRMQAAGILASARRAGKTTSLDTGWDAMGRWLEDVGPALPYVDLLFVNDMEAKMLTGCEHPEAAARRLAGLGAREVIVKLGAGGSVLYTPDQTYRAEPFPVDAVDTTGAGDSYAGAFLAAIYHGMQYREALRIANAVGALNVSKLGAVTGVLSWEETSAWIEDRHSAAAV